MAERLHKACRAAPDLEGAGASPLPDCVAAGAASVRLDQPLQSRPPRGGQARPGKPGGAIEKAETLQ